MSCASKRWLRVRLRRSLIGHPKDQKATAKALGLNRLNKTVVKPNNDAVRGMVRKIRHLVEWEEVQDKRGGGIWLR